MKQFCRRIAKGLDVVRYGLIGCFVVALVLQSETKHLFSIAWFLFTLLAALFDLPRITEPIGRIPDYLANFKAKRKHELPWIVAIAVVNLSFWIVAFSMFPSGGSKESRRAVFETASWTFIATNLALFALMFWAQHIGSTRMETDQEH